MVCGLRARVNPKTLVWYKITTWVSIGMNQCILMKTHVKTLHVCRRLTVATVLDSVREILPTFDVMIESKIG